LGHSEPEGRWAITSGRSEPTSFYMAAVKLRRVRDDGIFEITGTRFFDPAEQRIRGAIAFAGLQTQYALCWHRRRLLSGRSAIAMDVSVYRRGTPLTNLGLITRRAAITAIVGDAKTRKTRVRAAQRPSLAERGAKEWFSPNDGGVWEEGLSKTKTRAAELVRALRSAGLYGLCGRTRPPWEVN